MERTLHADLLVGTSGNLAAVRRRSGFSSRQQSRPCVLTRSQAPKVVTPVAEQLSGEDLEKWDESLGLVSDLGFEAEQATKALTRGFGWSVQSYWQSSKVNDIPEPEEIRERLAFLESIGIKGEDLTKVVKQFPEVLGCDLEGRLKPNAEFLEKNYFLKGPVRAKVILRKPKILGNVIDCEGNCKGECSRCWAQF